MPIKKLPSTYICYDKSAIAYYLCNKVQPSDLCIRLDITRKSGYILHHFYISHTLSHSRLHRNQEHSLKFKRFPQSNFSIITCKKLSHYLIIMCEHYDMCLQNRNLVIYFFLLFVRFIIAQINPPKYCL